MSHDASTDLYAVDYSKLVPYLIESIKTLEKRCRVLEGVKRASPEEVEDDGPAAKRMRV